MTPNRWFVAVVALLSMSAAAVLSAQKPMKVAVDLVLVPVTVTDRNSSPVIDLKSGNFKLFEDRIEQTIQYFSRESAPASVGIVFDISHSMEKKLELARSAAVRFLETGTPEDEYFLVEFSSRAQLAADFTKDVGQLRQLFFKPAEGFTALYDAVYLGLSKVKAGRNPRKALLLITDGEDNHSRYSRYDIREQARESDVQIYVIDLGRALISDLADMTGGHSFHGSVDDLPEICERIAEEMKNQYILGYASSNTRKDGKFRKIRVQTVLPAGAAKLSVRSREGYYSSAN
jgi:Ca-activated chloride channel family protein